jgi:hypothetical protein
MNRHRREVILMSWVARNNDPYTARIGGRNLNVYRDSAGMYRDVFTDQPVAEVTNPARGANLQLYLEEEYGPRITRHYLFATADPIVAKSAGYVKREIERLHPPVTVELVHSGILDPGDHEEIFGFLANKVPEINADFPTEHGHEYLININPGPPAAQCLWFVAVYSGLLRARLLRTNREEHVSQGHPRVKEVRLNVPLLRGGGHERGQA